MIPTWAEVQELRDVALACDVTLPKRIARQIVNAFTDGLIDRTARDRTRRAHGKKPVDPPADLRIMRDLALIALEGPGVLSTRHARRRFYAALQIWLIAFQIEMLGGAKALAAERLRRKQAKKS